MFMRLIIRGRQMGKTTELVHILNADPRVILLTYSEQEADRIRTTYRVDPRQVMSWREYAIRHDLHRKCKPVVDNIDLILNDVIGDWVEVGTLTQEEQPDNMMRHISLSSKPKKKKTK